MYIYTYINLYTFTYMCVYAYRCLLPPRTHTHFDDILHICTHTYTHTHTHTHTHNELLSRVSALWFNTFCCMNPKFYNKQKVFVVAMACR